MLTQRLRKPLIAGHVQHQATTAIAAAAGVMKTGWHYDKTLLHHLATAAIDFEIQCTRKPEHQLCVVMAVDDQVLSVVA